MTIETVKRELERYLGYAKKHEDFESIYCSNVAFYCFNVAFGLVEMASAIAFDMKNYNLTNEISELWNDTYRDLFLAEYRKELESK